VDHCGSETHPYRDEIDGNTGAVITNYGDKQGLSRVSTYPGCCGADQCSGGGRQLIAVITGRISRPELGALNCQIPKSE
jgi:hypothetical protein